MKRHRRQLKHLEQTLWGYPYFITTVTLNKAPVFNCDANATILAENIQYYKTAGRYSLLGFVIMPDHLHLLIIPKSPHVISLIMQGIKGTTSRMIGKSGNTKGSIWQPGYFDYVLGREKELETRMTYMLENPVRKGLVDVAEKWEYSSANPSCDTDIEEYL
jgi:REP element-mobilizing transposase RayT